MGVQINVKFLSNTKYTLDVELSSTVKDLKVLLEEKTNIGSPQQRLIFKGRILKDDVTLESCGMYRAVRGNLELNLPYVSLRGFLFFLYRG